jgi:hypothetical protein
MDHVGGKKKKWEDEKGKCGIIGVNNQVGEWLRRCVPVLSAHHGREGGSSTGGAIVSRTREEAPLFVAKVQSKTKGGKGTKR